MRHYRSTYLFSCFIYSFKTFHFNNIETFKCHEKFQQLIVLKSLTSAIVIVLYYYGNVVDYLIFCAPFAVQYQNNKHLLEYVRYNKKNVDFVLAPLLKLRDQ